MPFGKQHWQKVADLLKKFATPRSKELERELSAVRHDYRELGLRASTLASEGDTLRKTLGNAKQQIESIHGELGTAYKARDQLAVELQKQLESLVTEKNHTLVTDLEFFRNELDSTGKSHLQLLAEVKSLEQRISEAERNDLAAKDQKQALENPDGNSFPAQDITAANHGAGRAAAGERERQQASRSQSSRSCPGDRSNRRVSSISSQD